MGGLLSTIGNGLLGAAEGYGNYLIGEGQRKEKLADEDRQTQRAMALERFRQSVNEESADKQLGRQKSLVSYTAEENRVSNALEIRSRVAADSIKEDREFETWKKKNAIEFDLWKKKEGIQQGNAKDRTLYEAQVRAQYDADKNGLTSAGEVVDDATGTKILMFKDKQGNISSYDTGVVARQANSDGLIVPNKEKVAPTKPGWRSGGPSAPPADGGTSGGGSKVLSASEYQQAVADAMKLVQGGSPGWKGLDAAGVRKKLQDLYSSKGYALPAIR
jgi:hypothetical protein